MAIYKRDIVDINLETGNIHRSFLNHTIGYKDQQADHFGIRTFRNGEPVDLTGVSVQGVFMPPQGSPIAITSGNIVDGNVAEVVLPQACYNYNGQFTLAIKLVDSSNSITGTMRIVDGVVDNTHASGTVAPTSAVPTYQEILSTYDAMVAATAAANGAIAAAYSSSSTYAVGDYCIHDGGLYRCTTAITTAEAWTSGHWTAAKIGPDVSSLKSALMNCNNVDLLATQTIADKTSHGITYHFSNGNTVCHITGTSTGSFCNFVNSSGILPDGIKEGGQIWFGIDNNPSGVGIRVFLYPDTLPKRDISFYSSRMIYIPTGCTGILARLIVDNGTAIQEGGIDVNLQMIANYDPTIDVLSKLSTPYNVTDILNKKTSFYTDTTSKEVTFTADINNLSFLVTGTATGGDAFKNLINSSSALPDGFEAGKTIFFPEMGLSADGVRLRVFLYPNTLPNRDLYIDSPTEITIPVNCVGILIRLEVANGTAMPVGGKVIRPKILNGYTPDIVMDRIADEGIKLLAFGSSFTYSTLGYVPEIMNEIAPDVRFVLGICYNSGEQLSGHLNAWNNNTAYTEYSEYDSRIGKWTNISNSITGKQAVSRYKWDYIVLQQASRYTTDYDSLEQFADAISSYMTYPISFIYNLIQSLNAGATFPERYTQPTGKEKSDAMFNDMAAYAQRAMSDCIVSDVIPGGTAVQNARTTSLDEIATNAGDLADDNNGHLQNGIPVLIPGYAAAYKICQLNSIKPKMFSIPLNPTDAWLTEYDLYTKSTHGSCVGVTDANKLIAQKCAMMAIKHPYEITDMSEHD